MSCHKEKLLRRASAGLAFIITSSALFTGCGTVQESYTVYGSTNEQSRVTEETFSDRFSTMEYASEAEPESTPYGNTSETAAETGKTDEARKRKTIREDVSLVNNPEERRVIIVVPEGSKVDVLKDKEDGWYKIRYRGTIGYVKSGYFVEDYEAEMKERQKREAEEKKRKEEEAKKKAEEEAKKKAEAEAKKKAEEEAKRKAEEEAKRKKAEEEAKKKAEEEAKKKAEAEAKKKAEAEAKKKAEAEAKKKAEAEAKKKAEEEAKKKAEEEAKKKAEEEARKKAEEERARAMAAGEVTRKLAETVNLRDPEDPEVLFGIVPHGSYVTVLADLGDGWYLVDYDGMEGMIKGGYFTEEDP